MKFTITEMSVDEIFERAVKLLFTRLLVFFAIQLIVNSPVLVVQMAFPEIAIGPFGNVIALFPMLILGPIGSAAMLRVIAMEYLGQPISLGEAFTFALGRFLPLLGTSIIAGIGIGLGTVLCIVPGIYLWITWAFFSQVVIMEDLSGSPALSRSKELVRGYFWRVFGVLFLVAVCTVVLSAGVAIALGEALPAVENEGMPQARLLSYANYVIDHVAVTLLNTLGQAFTAICSTLLYFDLRNRKEAFDVGHIVAWVDQYRTWRDEPDPMESRPERGSLETGIKGQNGPDGPPPETGIKDTPMIVIQIRNSLDVARTA